MVSIRNFSNPMTKSQTRREETKEKNSHYKETHAQSLRPGIASDINSGKERQRKSGIKKDRGRKKGEKEA